MLSENERLVTHSHSLYIHICICTCIFIFIYMEFSSDCSNQNQEAVDLSSCHFALIHGSFMCERLVAFFEEISQHK